MKRCVVLFQSRIVRNVNPTFIWVLKRDVIDYRFLTKEQMVNHYCKAGSFTTKVSTEKKNTIYTTVYKHWPDTREFITLDCWPDTREFITLDCWIVK